MKPSDISRFRLTSQQITGSQFNKAKDLVSWMGAIQAQDFNMAKWAVGVRLHDSTDKTIESAIDSGEIIRIHVLRPTWHFVSPEDIHWMLDLTANQIKSSMKSRDKALELTDKVYSKSNAVIAKTLQDEDHSLREDLVLALNRANIKTDNNRTSHLMVRAELDGIVCSGKLKNNKQTYTLLTNRVSKTKKLTKDEALGTLALKYFTSHCPATLQDFIWWSGLSTSDSRKALEMVKSNFIPETIGKYTYWLTHSFSVSKTRNDLINFLPAYDEFIISYKDRSASLMNEDTKKAVSSNGIFRPVILINGMVAGLWKRTIKKDKILLETELFRSSVKISKTSIDNAVHTYAQFQNKKVELVANRHAAF
jgi:Winged helix DNA-binding domain